MTKPQLDGTSHSKMMSRVLALLVFSVFINYVDRGNLSIAAPVLKDELGISASQLGFLLSSFFWTYAVFQIVSGWLVDRLNVNWVLAVGFLLWSAATAATGFLHSFSALLMVRLILGIGESVAYPSYSKILGKFCPECDRGFYNSLIASGLACGPAFGMLVGGMLMARFGWRYFFIGIGSISLLWLVPWIRWMPRETRSIMSSKPKRGPGVLQILRQRSALGSCAALFCCLYMTYFMIAWLPFYLVRERHFTLHAMAMIGGAIYLTQAICAAITGKLADRWIIAGATPTLARKTMMAVGTISGGVFLLASAFARPELAVAFLILVGASIGITTSGIWAITQTLAGNGAVGRWTGLQNSFGNLSGALASFLTGVFVDRTGHFVWAFAFAALFAWTGGLCWLFFVGRIEPVRWLSTTPRDSTVMELA